MKIRAGSFAITLFFACMPLYTAQAVQLCGQFDTISVLNDEYRISNNIWGSNPGLQCTTAYPNSTYFSVNLSTHNSVNSVEAYPFIYRGCHWGGSSTTGSVMPILVSDINTAPFRWSLDPNGAGGSWNVAFEAWFTRAGCTPPDQDLEGVELMIWINTQGSATPGGTFIKTISIGGLTWNVYHAQPWSSWDHYIAYQLVGSTNYVDLDLKDFIDDSVSEGWLDTTLYLDNMEAGIELWADGQGMTSNSFMAVVNDVFSNDLTNFADFSDQWLRTDCDGANHWCGRADHPPENRLVDLDDLQSFVGDWLTE